MKPVMLMALNIVYDSTQPDSIGNWARISLLKEFHEPGIFETRNRIYEMLNAGRRKSVSPSYIVGGPNIVSSLKSYPRTNKAPINIEYMKASIRAQVENTFKVIKYRFGFTKARYRVLKK
jgi:hypothetical protein